MSQTSPPLQRGAVPQPPPATLSQARRGHRVAVVVAAAVALVVVVGGVLVVTGVLGSGSDSPRRDGASPETDASDAAEEVVPGVTVGTPENPYTGGESFTVMEDWTFTVGASDIDAWPGVASQWDGRPDIDQYQPDPGMVFVMAPASMTYTGPPTYQGRVKGFFVLYVAPDGTLIYPKCGRYGTTFEEFDWSSVDDEPSDEGALCAEVLSEQVEGGQWQVTMYTYDEDLTERLVEVYYVVS